MSDNDGGIGWIVGGIVGLVAFIFGLIALAMWGCPTYNVYNKRMSGEAQLAEALSNRKIAIQEAQAKEESSKHLAQADVERAKGVAQSNQIIGQSLRENEAYLTWLWIDALREGKNEVIYVPTEANLPILEAGRMHFRSHSDATK